MSDLNFCQSSSSLSNMLVVASSGAYATGVVPIGVLADAFFAQGTRSDRGLLNVSLTCLTRPRRRAAWAIWRNLLRFGFAKRERLQRSSLHCDYLSDCLRSFPLNVSGEAEFGVLETLCLFCSSKVKYIIDFRRSVSSPLGRPLLRRSSRQWLPHWSIRLISTGRRIVQPAKTKPGKEAAGGSPNASSSSPTI